MNAKHPPSTSISMNAVNVLVDLDGIGNRMLDELRKRDLNQLVFC